MHEGTTMDTFETRLSVLIDAHTAPADRPVDAVAMARAAMAKGGARPLSIGRVSFVGTRRRTGLLALVAVGLLAGLAVAVIGSRPRSSEPTIEKLVYSDPRVGVLLQDPPGSPPRVIVDSDGPGGQVPPCFASDILTGRSACWSSIAVSPSGRYLAIHAGAASVTGIFTLDGREVSHFYDGEEGSVRWSPVEDEIAVSHGVELHVVDAGGQTTERIPLPFDIEGVHGWSPDGRQFLVRAMDAFDLWSVDVVSGKSVRLTDTPSVHEHESDWSQDGSLIAYTADCGDAWAPERPCPSSIWTVRPDGSDRRRLTPENGYAAMGPTWAPDGRHLAYTHSSLYADNLGDGALYVIDADGSNPRRISTFDTGLASVMSWSPDGSTMVVGRARLNGAGGLEVDTWIMGADGSDPRILVPATLYVDQVWASSGDQPAATAGPRQ